MKVRLIQLFTIFFLISCVQQNEKADSVSETTVTDPLPSWNDGDIKKAIIAFVEKTTKKASAGFIPAADRIATFDNDGTLWSERPYVQELFVIYRVKKMVAQNPALAKKQPFKAVMENDKAFLQKGGEKLLLELVATTHTGTTEDEFESDAKDFFAAATYPGKNVPLKNIVYQPQLELLNYLRANGFKTFICTGGTIDFVRSISSEYYGIPKEQVVGSSFNYLFVDSSRALVRKPELNSFNDKTAKPVNIQLHIGQRPVFACGNEGGAGDIAMLEYCQGNHYPSFQLLINHDDEAREFFYQEKDSASLKAAAKNNWHVISMQKDWKKIYAGK